MRAKEWQKRKSRHDFKHNVKRNARRKHLRGLHDRPSSNVKQEVVKHERVERITRKTGTLSKMGSFFRKIIGGK